MLLIEGDMQIRSQDDHILVAVDSYFIVVIAAEAQDIAQIL